MMSGAGKKRLDMERISFSDEVIFMESNEGDMLLNFYDNCNFDVDAVFGTNVCTDENDDFVNVYADYDIATDTVRNHLTIILCKENDEDEELLYHLSEEDRKILRRKMEEYCGKTLKDYAKEAAVI